VQVTSLNTRIDAVDALRGFALAGIVFAHMIEQYIGGPRPVDWAVESNIFDQIVFGFNLIFVMGKFFSIFSILFGMSFAIMMGNAAAKGHSFSGRFIWRLTILGVIGFVHSLFYRGDILTIYVAIGLFLPLFYNMSSKTLWFIIGLLCLGSGRYLFFLLTGSPTILSYDYAPESPVVAAYVEILQNGSLIEVAKENFYNGFATKLDFQFAIFGRGYLTLAYFLVGMWLVRSGIMRNLEANKPLIRKVMWWSLVLTLVFLAMVILALFSIPDLMAFKNWISVFALTTYDLFNTALTAFLMSGFLLLFLRRPTGWLASLAPYGRMALTNYLLQTLIGTFILYGWGLGYLGHLHDWQMFLLSFLIIFFQIRLSIWWLSHYHFGPMEWLWRCGTYLNRVKLSRT
jgi:uncharacterized protein